MKRRQILLLTAALFCMQAQAQDTKLHFKDVHLIHSYVGQDAESIFVRGTTPAGKKLQLRLNGLAGLANGAKVKADCMRLSAVAVLDDRMTLEVQVTGVSAIIGPVDGRQYKVATFNLPSSGTVSCMLVNKTSFDFSSTSISWFEL